MTWAVPWREGSWVALFPGFIFLCSCTHSSYTGKALWFSHFRVLGSWSVLSVWDGLHGCGGNPESELENEFRHGTSHCRCLRAWGYVCSIDDILECAEGDPARIRCGVSGSRMLWQPNLYTRVKKTRQRSCGPGHGRTTTGASWI